MTADKLYSHIKSNIELKPPSRAEITQVTNYIYRNPPSNVVHELPTFFKILRICLMFGASFLIHPVLGIIAFFVDKIIEEKINERYYEKIMVDFQTELSSTEELMRKLASESPSKENKKQLKALTKYRDRLATDIARMRVYFEKITAYRDRARVIKIKWDKMQKKQQKEKESPPMEKRDFKDFYEDCMLIACNDSIENFIAVCEQNNVLNEFNLGRFIKDATGEVARADKQISKKIDYVADSVLKAADEDEKKKLRQEIIEGRMKLSTLFKHALAIGGAFMVRPFHAALGAIVWLVRRNYVKGVEKEKLLHELYEEMEIVEEKIKDASADGDKKKKYEYLRLRREIKKTIDKIRYGHAVIRPKMNDSGGEY